MRFIEDVRSLWGVHGLQWEDGGPNRSITPEEENILIGKEQRLHESEREDRGRVGVPRWPAAVALLVIGAIYAEVSDGLSVGPRVLLLGFVAMLLVPLMFAHARGRHRLSRWLAL
ncbi:MAG: hypothetical protein H0U55_09615, partial [Rubrobacteraceae bacterium]|nr:hypothetical protein [Rubrobacteraceae bacterium]